MVFRLAREKRRHHFRLPVIKTISNKSFVWRHNVIPCLPYSITLLSSMFYDYANSSSRCVPRSRCFSLEIKTSVIPPSEYITWEKDSRENPAAPLPGSDDFPSQADPTGFLPFRDSRAVGRQMNIDLWILCSPSSSLASFFVLLSFDR